MSKKTIWLLTSLLVITAVLFTACAGGQAPTAQPAAETDEPAPAETEAPLPTDTEMPAPAETEAPQPTDTQAP